jgi:DNA replication and repair protein RecF
MILTHLSLTNFRAFTRLDVDVPHPTLLVVGENAQGKTTLLEAIYYLATLSSFHTPTDRQLINFYAAREPLAVSRILAEFQRGNQVHRLEVRLIQDNAALNGNRLRREVLVDGVKRTAREALGHFNAVLFLPQMTNIVEGAPEERRRYLNMALAQVMPGYAQALSEYVQVLTQRNALLRQLAERGGDRGQLQYWDALLSERGAQIIQARSHALAEIERLAAPIHDRLTRGQEVLRLIYRPAYDPAAPTNGQYTLALDTVVDRSGFSLNQIQPRYDAHRAAPG